MVLAIVCPYVFILLAPVGGAEAGGAVFEGMDPLRWTGEPHARVSHEVEMSCERLAADEVEYRFRCTDGGASDSPWLDDPRYTATDLEPESEYQFIAEARYAESGEPARAPSRPVTVRTREASRFDAILADEIELVPLLINGDKDNRINIVIVNRWRAGESEPYNRPEMRETFLRDARDVIETSLVHSTPDTQEPFATQRRLYNVYALWWPQVPAWDPDAYNDGQWAGHWEVYNELRARLFLPWQHAGRGWVTHLAMVNSRGGGGGAGRIPEERIGDAMIEGNEIEAFFHEFSHTALGLGDTYIGWGCWGRADESANTTLVYQRDDVKWRAWIDDDTPVPTPYASKYLDRIGLFEGGVHRPAFIFRTTPVCTMGVNQFADHVCDVCIQQAAQRAYLWVDAIEDPYPVRDELTLAEPGVATFSISRIMPVPDTQEVEWTVNGAVIARDVDEVQVPLGAIADYEVTCSVVDRTPMIREDPPYAHHPRASRRWTIHNPNPGSIADPLRVALESTSAGVGGTDDGTITATVAGGAPPYSYYWSHGSRGQAVENLAPGTYSVRVVDSEFRAADAECTIERPLLLALDPRTRLEPDGWRCELAVSGDERDSYEVEWSTGDEGLVVSGLADGEYTYTVIHESGGALTDTVSLQAPAQPLQAAVESVVASTGENTGQVRLSVTGGREPYRFEWDGAPAETGSERMFLPPGEVSVTVRDANDSAVGLVAMVEDVPPFTLERPAFETTEGGGVRIADAREGYRYLWYSEDWPAYILREPRGIYQGTFTTAEGQVHEARGAVIPYTNGKWVSDESVNPQHHRGNNDYGSWVRLDAYVDGRASLPLTFKLSTDHEGDDGARINISGETERSVTSTEVTGEGDWSGTADAGELVVEGKGPDGGRFDLRYTARHEDVSRPLHVGHAFRPEGTGNYYVAAQDMETGAISRNRIGVAVTAGPERDDAAPLEPSEVSSADLLLWLDAADVDGDGQEDHPVWERGSLLGMRGKPGGFQATSFIIYEPNLANGRPVASWQWMWIQSLQQAVTGYRTLFVVYRDHELSELGTGPWAGVDAYVADLGGDEELLNGIATPFREGRAWLDGQLVDPYATPRDEHWHVATFELSAPGDRPIARTDQLWEGAVAEFIAFDGPLEASERRGVESYLRSKWVSEVHVVTAD
ncbi:MAG: hypothetical protein GF320_02545 [Armatimonadia bacterium]|nr:hypothetical protein [Armatimonadia bacterium]